ASLFDQRHRAPHISAAVETNRGINPAVVKVAREEAARVYAAAQDQLVPPGMESGILQVRIVLIRPEPGNLVVAHALAKHVARGSGALLDGVLPMLDADVPTE